MAKTRNSIPTITPATIAPAPIGVDVAKAELVTAAYGQTNSQVVAVPNNKTAIMRWLASLPEGCSIAMESTGSYHQLLADLAVAAGHAVYIINPKQIKHYRTATSTRTKTDLCDAVLIARFLQAEEQHLHRYKPLSPALRRLHSLLHRRATVVKARTQLHLSLDTVAEELGFRKQWTVFRNRYDAFLTVIDQEIEALLKQDDLKEKAARLHSIVGFGIPTTAALLIALERGNFKDAHALVAYFGFDPRARDSGQSNPKKRLSKQGDSEVRRLLFNAARSASLSPVWKAFYEHHRLKWTPRECYCILARKLIRVAWGLHRNQHDFSRQKIIVQYAPTP